MRAVTDDWESFLARELQARTDQGLMRSLRPFERHGASVVAPDGHRLLNLSSNDYLGLAFDPAVREAVARAAGRGAGATASRLVVGTDRELAALEERLAAFQGTEAALVLGSGYLGNQGTIAALVGPDDAVFSDRLNHASIVDGCRLSRAHLYRYGHLDVDQLEQMLTRADRSGVRRKLIVTESVFSMDGDVAPLEEIVELKERHGAALLVDEAHADGVFGPGGRGYAHELGIADRVDIHLGTFSKAFGVYGAYVAANATWIRFLVNANRSFIFTTGLPPAIVDAIDAALTRVEEADDLRTQLKRLAGRFRAELNRRGVDTRGSTTQILPAVVGESEEALARSRRLEEAVVLAVAIRPPTVPPRTARLRFSLSALHTDDDVTHVLDALAGLERD